MKKYLALAANESLLNKIVDFGTNKATIIAKDTLEALHLLHIEEPLEEKHIYALGTMTKYLLVIPEEFLAASLECTLEMDDFTELEKSVAIAALMAQQNFPLDKDHDEPKSEELN